ncbi:hypothetical protein Ancab_035131 [Ancistrocladus abbreviatus]
MADFASPVKAEFLSQPVQEIARSSKQVPERFPHKNGYPKASDDSVPWMDSLLIDLSLLLSQSSSSPAAKAELAKLRSALSTWGCFQMINHGISSSLLDEMHHVIEQFFELPVEEKQKYSWNDGYGNDKILYDSQTLDWNDGLCLKVYPEHQVKLNFWPEKQQNFRQILHDYVTNLRRIRQVLLKAMGRSLDLEETCFLKQLGESDGSMDASVKPHADDSIITTVLKDREVEGSKMTSGLKFPLPLELCLSMLVISQRVVTNTERGRISLVVFCAPSPDTEVGPLDELGTADRPQRYKKVKNYGELLFPYYQLGERPINAVINQ